MEHRERGEEEWAATVWRTHGAKACVVERCGGDEWPTLVDPRLGWQRGGGVEWSVEWCGDLDGGRRAVGRVVGRVWSFV